MTTSVGTVAEIAGVSVSTVSRALRDVPGISVETRKRVQRIARELGYVPSLAGSRLATGKTGTVAVLTPSLSKWFFGQVLAAAGGVLREAGYDVLLYELADDATRERFFDAPKLQGRADGVLILALQATPEELAKLGAQGLPVAMLGSAQPGIPGIQVRDRGAGRSAVRHLLNLGHERIAFIGIQEVAGSTLGGVPPAQRLLGYRDALAEAGLSASPDDEVLGENTIAGGTAAMAQLLCSATPPTAVFVASDEMAFGALRALRRAGISVPEDMSVVGFDNHELAEFLDLTTMDHAVSHQGSQAAQLLLAALSSPGSAPPALTIPATLVIRGSTAPPRPLRTKTSHRDTVN
ncbi:LacI family DNA-binding transcriptional regulator [Arthrobacter sp. CJ23]|uniref:LacI family DNA-binding transcriptional regulator n=1 Tax=Arthrobacter sp. CJ23 TaxID=2972479 RepID=UPI00215B8E4A|nr:LacI family DNA-binding transcriptional regulator [Arthrobacter sp. CJ23]UVJ39198.1 LacI family transcriptional regulator [Arthrobacter sp. CJ23]